jgi:uncharacterized protein involved in outer membrane biogenesis
MKRVKQLLLSIFFLVLVCILLIWALTKTIKPDTVKEYVSKQLTLITHQKSHLDGEFSWQIFPRPGIKVTKIHVGDERKQAGYTLDIDNLRLNLHLSPLLKGTLVFDEIIIDGFSISINPNYPGKSLSAAAFQPPKKEALKSNTQQFAIDRFLLMHGRLVINQPQQKLTLSNLQIEAKQLNLKKELFPLHIKANLSTTFNNNTLNAAINYKGRVGFVSSAFSDPKALQQTAMDGQLLIQNIQLNQLKIAKISANVKTRPGEIGLNPLNLSLYNGESIGDLTYQFAANRLVFNQTSTNLDAAQLTKDIAGHTLVKGNLDLSIHASTITEAKQWQNKLQGQGNVTIKDGVFYFIDIKQLVNETTNKIRILLDKEKHDVDNLLQLTQFSSINPNAATPFQLLSMKYRMGNNKWINDALLMQTDKLQLKGNAEVNLLDNALNGHVVATFMQTDPKIDKIQQMLGGGFPFRMSGSYKTPTVLPDTQIINPVIAKFLLKKAFDKPVKQLKQQLDQWLTPSENAPPENVPPDAE